MKLINTHPNRTRPHRGCKLVASVLVAWMVLLGASAQAADSVASREAEPQSIAASSGDPSLAQSIQFAYWRGRTCTTPACQAARPSGLADVASFGLAAFGGVWFSRRRKS